MTVATPPGAARRRAGWWLVAAICLLLIGAGSFAIGLRGRQESLAGPAMTSPAPSAAPATQPGRTRPALPRSAPVTLRIPAIGVKVPVSELGLNPDGTVQVPTDFQEPGWYRLGPSPGQVGSAVILGHVDSYRGPAVFFRLRYLRSGDRVTVTLADGTVVHFVVSWLAMYPKSHFPDHLVYASHGYSALQLVTCGGVFNTQTLSYMSNVVVYTRFASATGPPVHPGQPARYRPALITGYAAGRVQDPRPATGR